MRILALCAAAALAFPAAASASEPAPLPDFELHDAPLYAPEAEYEEPLSQRLADPAVQNELASTVAVLGEILLDMPLAPIVEPMAEIAGRDPGSVDPDLTLRKMRPEASDVPARVARDLPRAMGAMASMTDSLEAMRPALREMAERLEFGIDQATRSPR
ncbi:hypothetical protein [Pelagerythrobacter rhizovicinus]|uniref:DUF2059 domain-containing protein n=1 Tax=Pelagerythrobacter rhizovicinus TaxID=2268576 RepID=A0A4Q2KJA1_9SPHN|nr:hypothetical protein [Pelagerythrobacter rhizovicinus]RXZ64270.1 hypothetical protein ETX26_10185 [Pelagerythrobacter rhizovicinus]